MTESGTVRLDCRWHLYYSGTSYCRKDIFVSPSAPFRKLDLGCDCDPEKDYAPMKWKAEIYKEQEGKG